MIKVEKKYQQWLLGKPTTNKEIRVFCKENGFSLEVEGKYVRINGVLFSKKEAAGVILHGFLPGENDAQGPAGTNPV